MNALYPLLGSLVVVTTTGRNSGVGEIPALVGNKRSTAQSSLMPSIQSAGMQLVVQLSGSCFTHCI